MINWLTRWFSKRTPATPVAPPDIAAPAAATTAPPPVVPAVAADAGPGAAAPEAVDLPLLFYRALSNGPADTAPAATGQLIIDELARLVANPQAGADLVPRVPAVIPQLLKSLREDGMSGAELSRQLAQDVVLVAEVIREANSPYYHPTAPVKTIEGAVMLLGQNGLRMLLARVAFRPIINMQGGPLTRHVAPQIWSQSEKCALAASILAPGMQANAFEAYLAGLMENVGLMVAFRLIDLMNTDAALPQSDAFCAALFARARTVSARIGVLWDFPVTVTGAIEQAGQGGTLPLARTLALSDRLGKLRMLIDAGRLRADDPVVLGGLDAAALACLTKLHTEHTEEQD